MCTPIGITHQRLILYTIASLVVITLPQFQSMHMCELQTKHSSTYVGGANTTNLDSWYLSKIIHVTPSVLHCTIFAKTLHVHHVYMIVYEL